MIRRFLLSRFPGRAGALIYAGICAALLLLIVLCLTAPSANFLYGRL